MRFTPIALLSFMLLTPFSVGRAAEPPATLLVVGRIWTADAKQPYAEAVAINAETIMAVGTRAEMETFRSAETQVIDAGDGLVVPGMFDSHIHMIDGGERLASVQLRDAKTKEEFVRRIGEFAKTKAKGEWITGGDWDHTQWGGELPSRDWIDAVTPDNPVWVTRTDGHMSLANTAAMRIAKVPDDVKDIAGGEIVRDKDGRPTGMFKDRATTLITRSISGFSMQKELDATAAASNYLAARGITSVCNMGTLGQLEIFRVAQRKGLLKTRISAYTALSAWERLDQEVKERGTGDNLLRIGGIKGFVDGSLGSHTAAFFEPFDDKPGDRGLLVTPEENLEKWITGADKAGLQLAVHAIGDRAIHLLLDIYERTVKANGPRERRLRIEHAQHILPADFARFKQLNIIASVQPYHAIDDGRWFERAIGKKRCETTYAFRTLLDNGIPLAFGSDWFVAPPSPIEGIYAAVTRRTIDGKNPNGWYPEQKVTLTEALKAYTIDAAYATFLEQKLGSIEPGKLADIVVLGRDPFDTPPSELNTIPVRKTILGGKVVFDGDAKQSSN